MLADQLCPFAQARLQLHWLVRYVHFTRRDAKAIVEDERDQTCDWAVPEPVAPVGLGSYGSWRPRSGPARIAWASRSATAPGSRCPPATRCGPPPRRPTAHRGGRRRRTGVSSLVMVVATSGAGVGAWDRASCVWKLGDVVVPDVSQRSIDCGVVRQVPTVAQGLEERRAVRRGLGHCRPGGFFRTPEGRASSRVTGSPWQTSPSSE